MSKESMEVDILIIGAGPAGLGAAIRLAQLAHKANKKLEICVLEKGAEVGSHILSGAVMDPRALNELLPDWVSDNEAPIKTAATQDKFLFLTKNRALKLPTPPQMRNNGNYIISLGKLCQWLARQAEQLGVQIYPGFAGKEVLYDDLGKVIGVGTGDMGIAKSGEHKSNYHPGMNLFAKYTIFSEGCRGSLSKKIIQKFDLQRGKSPQTYGLGIKELWEVPADTSKTGSVLHTVGWPLDTQTYGGSFLYYLEPNLISLGFVIGLDYKNTYLSPFNELQRFKLHPTIKSLLKNGRCVSYGARSINEGGFQSIPKLCFPGGLLVGCAAGFLNVAKIKGIHTALKSGMLAAEAVFNELEQTTLPTEILEYEKSIRGSWVWDELHSVRNIRPAFCKGLWVGLGYAALTTYLLKGKEPWTFKHQSDHESLQIAQECKPINYPKPDNKISFDKMSCVQRSNTFHEGDQPSHLVLTDQDIPITINLEKYDAPEQRFCPAGVYEIIYSEEGKPKLQINAQNCLHCKACDIKDPTQNINWTTPEGGGGPNYNGM